MTKAFASQGDLTEKTISFVEVGNGLWAFTAEGDPNSGVIIGDESVMIVEAQATPRLANKVIEKVREQVGGPGNGRRPRPLRRIGCGFLSDPMPSTFQDLGIGDRQLQRQCLRLLDRIDTGLVGGNGGILERPEHDGEGVHLTQAAEELGPEPVSAGTRHGRQIEQIERGVDDLA